MATQAPILFAAQNKVRGTLVEMRECIAGFPVESLNWRPAGEDTNSAAVLVTHSLQSTRNWLCVALAEPLPERDRESEFRVEATESDGLLRWLDEMSAECLALLDPSRTVDWAAVQQTHTRPNPQDDTRVPQAWALLHAIEHLREHLGQLQLTRQLWERTTKS